MAFQKRNFLLTEIIVVFDLVNEIVTILIFVLRIGIRDLFQKKIIVTRPLNVRKLHRIVMRDRF